MKVIDNEQESLYMIENSLNDIYAESISLFDTPIRFKSKDGDNLDVGSAKVYPKFNS